MAFEWVAGLFQSDNQQTRGLSGDQAHSVALDDSNPYYNYRLRRHKAEGDLVADAGLLWYTSPYVKRRSGLGTHVGAEVGEGTANYTDVLLILSREDYARATAEWQQNAIRTLQQEFDNFCRRENFNRLHAHRPLGVRIIEEGSPAMGGQTLGLHRGEFITGLLPNLYTGPVRGSYPVIGVHLNLPGVWEGYQEVGRLYNDQILFTLGNHWLDNFSHPSLQQAALYRLRQYPDGSFVHIINPDLQDQYRVTSTNQGGASVLTLATRAGQPLAYMVLAVIDPPSARPSQARTGSMPPVSTPASPPNLPTPRPSQPQIAMPKPPPAPPSRAPTPPRDAPRPQTRGEEVPAIAPPMLLDEIVSASSKAGLGGKTIIPDAPSERIFTLQERGALLQKVHFSAFMLGYDVYLGTRGELGTHVEDPAATFQVRKRSVSLVAHVDGVNVGGRPVPAGVEVPIEGDVVIEVAGQRLDYRDLRGLQVEGWPYVGEIRRPASSTYMIWGEDYQIGRSRECRVVLPDEPRNDNIHWKPSVGDGATIRARTGEIPKSRFYTDSIMVASEHAAVDLRGELPKLVCTARHCYVYVRRNQEVLPLYPATSPQQPKEMELQPGDEVLIGNCLFHVGFTTASDAVDAQAPQAPGFDLSAAAQRPTSETPPTTQERRPLAGSEGLAGAVAAPDLAALDTDTSPPPPVRGAGPPPRPTVDLEDQDLEDNPVRAVDPDSDLAPAPEDPPSRSGRTPPPAPPPREAVGMDSIVFDELPSRDLGLSIDSTTSPLGLDGPIDVGSDDEPTVPGLVLPREALEGPSDPDRAEVTPRWGDDPRPGAAAEADLSVDDPPVRDVGRWDREDWSEEDSFVSEPPALAARDEDGPRSTSVPPPFPDMPDVPSPAPDTMPPDALPVDPPEPAAAREPTPLAPPPREAAPAPVQATNAPVEPAPARERRVVYTDDAEAQFELGRPMHLILAGWTVNGEVVCGNHDAADLVIPENRIRADQRFEPRDYFRLRIRGRKGHLEILAPTEVLVDEADPAPSYDDPDAHVLDVIRRDDAGEEDFAVRLKVVEEKQLPDPRARLVSFDNEDPLAAALVTRGLPKGAPRQLVLDGVQVTMLYDGSTIRVSDYLATYRRGDGFHPFFVSRGGERFRTAPEDGSPFELRSGDRMVVGHCVYVLREE